MTAPATTETKTCVSCGKTLKGRVDKKFCDDYCRNNYNNQQKAKGSQSSYVRNINNTLLKNRRILEGILPGTEETAKASKDKLQRLGLGWEYRRSSWEKRQRSRRERSLILRKAAVRRMSGRSRP